MSNVIKPNASSCTVCNDKKVITCPACESNRKIDGELKRDEPCSLCNESGTIKCPFCKEIWQIWQNKN